MSASLTWRYIGAVSEDNNSSDPTLHFSTFNGYDSLNAGIPAFNDLDVEATWNLNEIVQIRAGANNVLDKDPPLANLGHRRRRCCKYLQHLRPVRPPAVLGVYGEILRPICRPADSLHKIRARCAAYCR